MYDAIELGSFGRPLSLNAEYNGRGTSETSSLLDYLGSEDSQINSLGDRIELSNTFGSLDKREKMIIYLKFYAGLSQAEIGKRLGISQMHVSRLQRCALGKLRRDLTG